MARKTKILICILLSLLICFAAVYFIFLPKATAGSKSIEFQVSHLDGELKSFSIKTDAENLRDALEQEKLILGEEGPYGLFVKTVDGETVDESKNQWWCFTRDGEMLSTGVDSTLIADGEHYEAAILVY